MEMSAKTTVEILGPCSDDVASCEIMRAAIAAKNVDPNSDRAQVIRSELARPACLQ